MKLYKENLFVEMYTPHEGHLHGFKRVLVEGKTRFQQVEIVDTWEYGRCLLLDGKMQSSQADEHIYHELLVHPAMASHPDPREILILGGGEGATLREVLRYPGVRHVDMIEIDGQVLDFAKKHLHEWHHGAFDDPRVSLIVGDGREYLSNNTKKYDVIIIDISDPGSDGPAYLLYTIQFYEMAAKHLSSHGMLSLQAGTSSVVHGHIMASVYKTLCEVFKMVCAFEGSIPSFDLPWGFCLASQTVDPRKISAVEIEKKLATRGLNALRVYDGETHEGLFRINKALRNTLEKSGRIIRDQDPIYTPL